MDSGEGHVRVHFHDTVQINIHPPSQMRWDDPPPVPCSANTPCARRQNIPPQSFRRRETQEFHKIFLMSKPKPRGVFQIFIAHLQLALGVALIYIGGMNYTRMSFITFWGPTIMVTSGSMALRARVIPSCKLVKACFILHFITCFIALTGLALCAVDDFQIYKWGFSGEYGNVGTLAIINFLLMTNIIQMLSSGCISLWSFRALKCIASNPPQTTAAQNRCAISLDPPAYSEVSNTLPQVPALSQSLVFLHPSTLLHPSESIGPPAYSPSPGYSQNLETSQTPDPPPPYSE